MKLTNKLYTHSVLLATGIGVSLATLGSVAHATSTIDEGNALNITKVDINTADDAKTQFINIANTVINIVLLISGVLAVFYLIWSGIRYITAGGDQTAVKEARSGILNAVVGIVIIIAAFFIIRFAVGLGHTVTSSAN